MEPPLRLRSLPGHRRRKIERRVARFWRSCHWIVVENTTLSNNSVATMDIRIRRWHPGFWLAYIKIVATALAGIRIKFHFGLHLGEGDS